MMTPDGIEGDDLLQDWIKRCLAFVRLLPRWNGGRKNGRVEPSIGPHTDANPVQQHVVVRWKPNLPKKRDEPWFLMTDLKRAPKALSVLYGKRMTIEELFRDHKSKRSGWSLRHTKITKADRIDRLLLILALTYILLVGVGLCARARFRPGMWCSSNNPKQCSAFTIGRYMIDRMQVPIRTTLAAVLAAILAASPNWG